MKLYILRHGRALSAADAGVSTDFDRPLSPQGREDVRKAGAYLRRMEGRPSLLLASPLVRAQQTSSEVSTLLEPRPGLRTYRPLENQMSGMDLFRRLVEDEIEAEEALLVGHQPQLGDLATYLTGKYLTLKPAGLIALETDDRGKGSLLWYANPSDFPA